uniref:GIY-YIG endonuclease n=1 Tax=Monilinia fructicola TaxID=38448 RepID=A0A889XQ24_MONFR|nr:GIY-YIG endonuclease [Monilinia fructicola]QRF72235.1 GIY-YIG endonuclease [Monilinia fructicola]QYB19426.1 GIY-YIG endonuclease [Monilinia fructicola]QYB19487.1 GIY-YIG endonuclease [Monilinia fructicola]QYB19549.1 GIY-YIG endonuclease [Monilinia fructicola]QYB19611.1 GIY-YIG endonuclease [Monilinia fructicola]
MVFYKDFVTMKRIIIEENSGKSGIYLITNIQSGDFYVGQAGDLAKRFKDYTNPSYLTRITDEVNSIIGRALKKYGYSNFSFTVLEYCNISDLNTREQYYFDVLNPVYNILKKVGGLPRGITRSLDTRNLMSIKKVGESNPLFGKLHSNYTKDLIRQKALGRKHSEDTKLLMASKRGFSIDVYEKCTNITGGELKKIGGFISARKAGDFLGISHSTVRKYLDSKELFKDKYKFTSSGSSDV